MSASTTKVYAASKLYASNQSLAASFTNPTPTTTAPTGDGVLYLPRGEGEAPNNVELVFVGTDANNETFDARVFLWRKVGEVYFPVLLIEVTCTLSATVGVSGQTVTNTDRFVDTIVASNPATAPGSVEILSPGSDMIASMLVDARGAHFIQVIFDQGASSSGAAANALATQV